MSYTLRVLLKYAKKKLASQLGIRYYTLKPNFLIPGAGRSGTTTLYSYLNQHPEVYLPEHKEPKYFTLYYHLGKEWYLRHFLSSKDYKAVGEASTNYMIYKEAPKRIYDFNPDFKLIFILRNPVDKAYGRYKKQIMMRGITESFENTLKKYFYSYIIPGKYFTLISRFLDYFPKKNMLFIIFEEFIKNPNKFLKDVCSFLNINAGFKFNSNIVEKNVSTLPISLKSKRIYNRYFHYDPSEHLLTQFTKIGIYHLINKLNHFTINTEFPKMKESTKKYLKKIYKDEISLLEDLIRRDLSFWK